MERLYYQKRKEYRDKITYFKDLKKKKIEIIKDRGRQKEVNCRKSDKNEYENLKTIRDQLL